MTALQRRFRNVLARIGESATVSSTTIPLVKMVITAAQAKAYLPDSGVAAISSRPIYLAYVPFDAVGSAGDSVAISTQTWQLYKTVSLQALGQTVAQLWVMA